MRVGAGGVAIADSGLEALAGHKRVLQNAVGVAGVVLWERLIVRRLQFYVVLN